MRLGIRLQYLSILINMNYLINCQSLFQTALCLIVQVPNHCKPPIESAAILLTDFYLIVLQKLGLDHIALSVEIQSVCS